MSANPSADGATSKYGWQKCATWLTRCGALRPDHKAHWPRAKPFDLAWTLRDGVLLCNLLNSIDPGSIDIQDVSQRPQMAQFLCLRNIKLFLSVCSSIFGLSDSDLFEPSILFDLSDFHQVLYTLSVLSSSLKFQRKGILGFSISRDKSEQNIYEDLQEARIGRDSEDRRRRLRRRDGDKDGECDDLNDEDGYDAYGNYAQNEKLYQELCSSDLPPPLPSDRGGTISGGEKRDRVVQELIETEGNYLEVLNNLQRHFAKPLGSLLRPEDASRIFFGIKDLSEIHTGVHSQLKKTRDGVAIAQIFLDCRKKFLIYGDYCANLTLAQSTLHEACAKNELINQDVISCQQKASNGKFKLRDILSVPMQRVLKYHLLLDQLVQNTPKEWTDDLRQLAKAKEVMVDVAQYIDEVKRDSDALDIVRAIWASIVDWNVTEDAQLKDIGRLLNDGELKVSKSKGWRILRLKTRYAFVFEQVILLCKIRRGDRYIHRETLRLDDYRLQEYTGPATVDRNTRWSYQWLLVHKQTHNIYTLYAETREQRQMWIKALRDAIDNVNPVVCFLSSHRFELTTFETARSCQRCGKFLKGRIFQGYSCVMCRLAVHKQCIASAGLCTSTSGPPAQPPPLLLREGAPILGI